MQGDALWPNLAANQVDPFGKEMLEEDKTFMYKYKGYIPVPLLGIIDDKIVVTLAGYNAAQMNRYLNVKSADKYLQFGLDKCKAMVVGKRIESYHAPKATVDSWETSHEDYGELIEKNSRKEAHGK